MTRTGGDIVIEDADGGPSSDSVQADSAVIRTRPNTLFRLPGRLQDYLKTPRATSYKILGWLGARWQLRACTEVGSWPRIRGRVVIRNGGEIVLGERVHLLGHDAQSTLTSLAGGRLEIGDRTFLNYGADIVATKMVKIGADCMIGTYANILDNDFHGIIERYEVPKARPVTIGDKVWIGNHAIVLPGVTIGEGAIVGAGSVVTCDVPSWSVAVGNPARVIKTLQIAPAQ